MECTESGWREIDYKGCVCSAGYEPDEYNQKCIGKFPNSSPGLFLIFFLDEIISQDINPTYMQFRTIHADPSLTSTNVFFFVYLG